MKTKPLALLTLALLPSFFTPANADLKDGLVAHWSFDDCRATDNSGNGHDGTLGGNPQCVDGVKGKAFSFDGKSDYIDLGTTFPAPKQFTISTWINIENLPTYSWCHEGVIFAKGSPCINEKISYHLSIEGSYDPMFMRSDVGDGSGNYNAVNTTLSKNFHPLKTNQWLYVVSTYDGQNLSIYGNGDKIMSTQTKIVPQDNNLATLIGKSSYDSDYPTAFSGKIDDLRIYNRALTEAEVMELYNGEPEQTTPPLYTFSQPLDNIYNALNSTEQMNGTILGQCVYGGYCARTSLTTAHNGVDYMVAKRTPVYAICDGTIKNVAKGGNILNRFTVIDHSNCGGLDKLYAYYGHIDPTVKKGAKVEAGQQIGTVADWQANSHLHLSLSKNYVTSGWGYTPVGKSTPKDCKKESVVARRQLLDAKGWLDPIEIGMKSDWNSVLLKGGTAKTGCNAPEQVYTDKTLPYSPWK